VLVSSGFAFQLINPASEYFDALQVRVKCLLVELLVVGNVLFAFSVDSPWKWELFGVVDRYSQQAIGVSLRASVHKLPALVARNDAV
jgi:hypothetical protein